jgi:hypothetical protein
MSATLTQAPRELFVPEPVPDGAEAASPVDAPAETGASGELPDPATVGRAVLGFGALGLTAALGSSDLGGAMRILPTALVVDLGALVLTGPALLVGHQYLGLEAPVPKLAAVLSNVFCRAGTVALGLAPALLFFAATSGLAPALHVLFLAGIATFALTDVWTGLLSVERAAVVPDETPRARTLRDARMHLLVLSWMVLTSLVGLRLGFHLAGI